MIIDRQCFKIMLFIIISHREEPKDSLFLLFHFTFTAPPYGIPPPSLEQMAPVMQGSYSCSMGFVRQCVFLSSR